MLGVGNIVKLILKKFKTRQKIHLENVNSRAILTNKSFFLKKKKPKRKENHNLKKRDLAAEGKVVSTAQWFHRISSVSPLHSTQQSQNNL